MEMRGITVPFEDYDDDEDLIRWWWELLELRGHRDRGTMNRVRQGEPL